MPEEKKDSAWVEVVDDVVGKASKKEINFFVKVFAIGLFFIMIAVAYSIIFRGSVAIDVSSTRSGTVDVNVNGDADEEKIEVEIDEDEQ